MIGIRGATQVAEDTAASIGEAVAEMMREICERNALRPEQVISAIFTLTPDLTAAFPAATARDLGWHDVPMIGAQEVGVVGALPRVCRVLIHANAPGPPHHVYLGGARSLRPDLAGR